MIRRTLLLLALAGLPKAAVTLADDDGYGVAANADSVAADTLAKLRARAAGDPVAQYTLGNTYFNGESAAQDLPEALKWYGRAAEQGFEPAEDCLGCIYTTVAECKNVAEGLKWYRLAAGQAFIPAEYHLGQFYENGGAGPENATESAIWYQRAAEHVRAFAQSSLGMTYRGGKSVSKDTADGLRLLLTEYAIGSMYAAGSGVPKDSAEAGQWYRRAAEQGLDSAQFQLGEMYAKGEGVAKDSAQAVKWFRMAAEQGNRLWQLKLGNKLFIGEGVPKDSAEAVKWFRMAAFQGNQSAQLMLGTIYETGAGVPKDEVEALAWFNIGAASGGDWVVQHRNDLEAQLGHDATQAAQQRSGELFTNTPPAMRENLVNAASLGSPPFDASQLDQRPVPTFQARPIYPSELRRAGTSGEVLVDFIVDVSGNVRNAFAASSSQRGFEEAAVKAVSKWRFKPGRKDGRAVNVHMQVPIEFAVSSHK